MWKNQQNSQRVRKQIALAFLALGILIFTLVLAKLVGGLVLLSQPFNLSSAKHYSWDGKSSINLLVYSRGSTKASTSVISFNPIGQKVVLLNLSDDTYTEVAKGYGFWKLGSIYKLGQEQTPKVGSDLLKLSVAKLLGLPIDGFITLKGDNLTQAGTLISSLRKNPLYPLILFPSIRTDLSFLETIRLLRDISLVRSDKVTSLDLAQSQITESKLLPDSSRVLGVDNVKLDLFVREEMLDSSIVEEGMSVAIFNATQHQGLAQEAARIVTNLGGNAVMLASADLGQARSSVTLREDGVGGKKSFTYLRLSQVFAPWCLSKACTSNDQKVLNSRAQVNIILGEDFYDLWYKR